MPSKSKSSKAKCSTAKSSEQSNTHLVTARIRLQEMVHNTILSWRVPDFEKLSHGVVYFQTYERPDFKCSFRVLKTEDKLSLTVTSPCIASNTKAEFLILDEPGSTSLTRKAQKLRDGVYTARFENTDYSYPESGYLHRGVLTAAFKYASDVYSRYKETPLIDAEVLSDLGELCSDLKRMYLESIYPDFEVHVDECVFSTHKFILTARSEYFQNILTANKSLTHQRLDGIYLGVMHELFLYMYCGEFQERSMKFMLEMYLTAWVLQVDSLYMRCLLYFEEKICPENYKDICKFVVEHRLFELEKQIIDFGPKNLPGVNIKGVIAKLKRDMIKHTK